MKKNNKVVVAAYLCGCNRVVCEMTKWLVLSALCDGYANCYKGDLKGHVK